MYKRILLAYDGSREGLIALREGALLAKQCSAQVFLLSVLPNLASLSPDGVLDSDAVASQLESYKAVLARGTDVAKRLGLEPTAKLVIGEPAPQIGAFAKEIAADLVVVGHRRQNALERWWSGATGAYVSDHVRCSVLIACNAISDEAFAVELQGAGAP